MRPERIVGKWQCRKNQKSVSLLKQQLHWQNLPDITALELQSLLKARNFQGKPWLVNYINFGQFYLLAKQQLSVLALSHTAGRQLCTCSWSSLYVACGSQRGQRGPCYSKYQEALLCHLFLLLVSEVCRQRDRQPLFLHLPHFYKHLCLPPGNFQGT